MRGEWKEAMDHGKERNRLIHTESGAQLYRNNGAVFLRPERLGESYELTETEVEAVLREGPEAYEQ